MNSKIKKTTGIIFSVIVITLFGCAYQKLQALLDGPLSVQAIKLPLSITRLTIQDTRAAVDNRDIKISKLAFPGWSDQIVPALSSSQKELLEKEFSTCVSNGADDYKAACTIHVMEGVMRYKSSWSGEEMFVKSKIQLVLSDSLHTPFLASAIGEVELSFKSNIANKENFEKLYQKAMKTALFKANESISGIVKPIVSGK